MRIILRLAILVALVVALNSLCVRTRPVQVLNARLGGVSCDVEFDPAARDTVRVYERGSVRREIWRGIPKSLRPWKIEIADVDGDGKLDLGVGVYRKAKFHRVMAKRPFVYTWNGKGFEAKWLGSRLSRPFTDFAFAEFGGGTKLVAIEETRDGADELAVYEWNGFGFTRVWTGCRAKKMSGLAVTGKSVSVETDRTDRTDPTDRTYRWDGRELKEVRL